MHQGTQRNTNFLIATTKRLLVVAVAVCLLATLAHWAVGLPVKAATVAAQRPAPTAASPTLATAADLLRPSATPAPAAEGLADTLPRAPVERPRWRLSAEVPAEKRTELLATATPEPASTSGTSGCTVRPQELQAQFLADVTVPDGTVLGSGERFTKTWRVRNAGSCDWAGYRLVFASGDRLGAVDQPIPDTPAGQVAEISVELTSPEAPGDYAGTWQIRSPDGANLGILTCAIVVDGENDAPAASEPTPVPAPAAPSAVNEERWIDVDLAQQLLTAYEGHTPVHTTLVSTGLPHTPTPVGQFRIWVKFRYDDMAGAGYYIEDVPFVMYFHGGYGLHGVTWHGNFGHPMSHGCVNLPTEEAEWLFNWADVGTLVNIHD